MADMGSHSAEEAHPAAGTSRRDHLWVLAIIAACALIEVWASWLVIGSVSGFPKFGRMTTGWILPVTTEAYWGYALWAWLAGAPGPRSRAFAMWSAIVMFALSLGGQEAGHLVSAAHRQAPLWMAALITPIPLVAVGLSAILAHLRHLDRDRAEAAGRKAAEADEITALRAALDTARGARETDVRTLREELEAERAARETARREAALRPAIEAERDAFRKELETARAAAQAAGEARTQAAREAAGAAREAALREARCGELEMALDSARAELRTVREARETETRNLRTSLDAERNARAGVERDAVLRPVLQAQLDEARAAAESARTALEAAEAARAEAGQRAARAEAKAASLTRKAGAPAGSRAVPAGAPAGRTQLEIARAAREDADKILAAEPDISGAQLAERVGMSERWGQEHKKQFLKRSLGETG